MPVRRNKKGIVYVAWNKAMPSMVKIGVTEGCAHKRVALISSQSVPFRFELIAQFETDKCLEFEQYCHDRLKKLRVGKEFFKIKKTDALDVISYISTGFECGVNLVDKDPLNEHTKDMR